MYLEVLDAALGGLQRCRLGGIHLLAGMQKGIQVVQLHYRCRAGKSTPSAALLTPVVCNTTLVFTS